MNRELPQQLARRLSEREPTLNRDPRFVLQPFPPGLDVAPEAVRPAAVLLLLYPWKDQWHLPLTLRPSHLAAHAGQVSLPGGAVEPEESSVQAALREFHEELGDDGQPVQLLGSLSPIYVHASGFQITPWVAAIDRRPAFEPNPAEVEEILEVPLLHLLDPANRGTQDREFQGRIYAAPHFSYRSHRVWGATCRILGELVTVLEGFRIPV